MDNKQNQSKKSSNDNLEKTLTTIFGALGSIAILINLFTQGWSIPNLLTATKDIAGLVIIIAVFLVTNKLFRKSKQPNFRDLFEKQLVEWIEQNKYLISDINKEGKGKDKKRYCSMVIDHTNIITKIETANIVSKKGAFVYLPTKDEKENWKDEFEFRFNNTTFKNQNTYRTIDGDVDLKKIIEVIAQGIKRSYDYLDIDVKPQAETIKVLFDKMEKTDENAKRLVEMVDDVKIMVLAIA